MVNLDQLLVELNQFGRYQIVRYLLICLAGLIPSCFTYLHTFVAANAKHRCTHPDIPSDNYFSNYSEYFNETDISLQKCTYTINGTTSKCDRWVFDKTYYQTTLTEEWSMVCDRSVLRSTVQTVYFCGYLIGSMVLGILADRFGRRPILLSSFIVIIIGGSLAAFGPQRSFGRLASYILYTIGRFFIAFGTRGINVTGFVLAMELVGSEEKTLAGIFFKFSFAFGQFILVGLAYFIRDWRTLSWICVVLTLPFLSYFFVVPESLRWLITKGKNYEATKVVQEIARINKRHLNEESWDSFLKSETNSSDSQETLLSALKSPILFILMTTLSLNWAANNFVFYGLGLKSNDLGLNPYLTYTISVFSELLGYIVIFFVSTYLGRKRPYFAFQLMAGLCCLSVIFINDSTAIIVMAMLGKFFAASTYAVIQLYSTEIFPTSIRNSCMGVCSMVARLGPIAAPLINGLGDKRSAKLPFIVFGISGLFAAVSSLILPETRDRDLPQNIKETETFMSIKCLRKLAKNRRNGTCL